MYKRKSLMEDIDKTVMELLVQEQPIGIWPIVGF
jgi:hypothetical protein